MNSQKNWGQDLKSLSGRKKNSHTQDLRVKNDPHRKYENTEFFCKKHTTVKG